MMEDRVQGEFNSALEYLRRISVAFEACNEASSNMDAGLWGQALVVAFKELSTKMKKDELETKQKELQELISITTAIKGRSRHSIPTGVYWRLFNFELFLRSVFNEAGLEMKNRADPGNILFGGGM
jgi:hypothetical protein